jgi:hypothetical protein
MLPPASVEAAPEEGRCSKQGNSRRFWDRGYGEIVEVEVVRRAAFGVRHVKLKRIDRTTKSE